MEKLYNDKEHFDGLNVCHEMDSKIESRTSSSAKCSEKKFTSSQNVKVEFPNAFFRNLADGIVEYKGIELGVTKLGDLKELGMKRDGDDRLFLSFKKDNFECVVNDFGVKDLKDEDVKNDLFDIWGHHINEKVFINIEKFVSRFSIDFGDIMNEGYENWEVVNAIENCGFQQIQIDDEISEDAVYLVSNTKMCGDYYVLFVVDTSDSYVLICPFKSWVIRKTGETIKA